MRIRIEGDLLFGLLLCLFVLVGSFGVIYAEHHPPINEAKASPAPKVEVREVNIPVYIQPDPQPVNTKSLGDFTITYYTAGKESTGKSKGQRGYGITRSGATVWDGVTVAVDPKVIPLGSYLYIEGIGLRVAQDTGGAINGKDIDVFVPDVDEANRLGRHKAKVYLIGGN